MQHSASPLHKAMRMECDGGRLGRWLVFAGRNVPVLEALTVRRRQRTGVLGPAAPVQCGVHRWGSGSKSGLHPLSESSGPLTGAVRWDISYRARPFLTRPVSA